MGKREQHWRRLEKAATRVGPIESSRKRGPAERPPARAVVSVCTISQMRANESSLAALEALAAFATKRNNNCMLQNDIW